MLQIDLLDITGIDFKDKDSLRDDYNVGCDVYDVIDEIATEYEYCGCLGPNVKLTRPLRWAEFGLRF